MNSFRRAAHVAEREISLELVGGTNAVTALPFVAALVLFAGLGFGPRSEILTATAPGLVWIVVIVAALPLAGGVASAERRDDCWDLLRALTRPGEILAGKVAALWLWLLACWALATLLSVALLGAELRPVALLGGLAGTLGIAVSTVVFGVLLPDASRRPGMLAVLLPPGVVPVLLAGTQIATAGVPAWPWLALLLAYDVVTVTAAWAVFPNLLEE
ncbi:heme exporter protein CcmB [Nocardiopsis tropica]|uniref:Heme exporter protein CcmB n=1 Tax=Nocardiopsis tropica TaxID=109330 RepID=A0ABU7KK53_9ACTN|nr:heme exporter protein CcmB [Nocardiopsis umidischolae]MEE2049675.1 heme exporter protein CcmB [Nocardiopsis umidischolae]